MAYDINKQQYADAFTIMAELLRQYGLSDAVLGLIDTTTMTFNDPSTHNVTVDSSAKIVLAKWKINYLNPVTIEQASVLFYYLRMFGHANILNDDCDFGIEYSFDDSSYTGFAYARTDPLDKYYIVSSFAGQGGLQQIAIGGQQFIYFRLVLFNEGATSNWDISQLAAEIIFAPLLGAVVTQLI